MGFWDKDIQGPLDDMFDLNRDGMLDPGEEAYKYEFLNGFLNDNDHDEIDDVDDLDEFDF